MSVSNILKGAFLSKISFLKSSSLITIEVPSSSHQIDLNLSLFTVFQSFLGKVRERKSLSSSGSETQKVRCGLFIREPWDRARKAFSSIIDLNSESSVDVWPHNEDVTGVSEPVDSSLGEPSGGSKDTCAISSKFFLSYAYLHGFEHCSFTNAAPVDLHRLT
jgi:hypothetical protein